jgi:hypothetical protein
MSELKEFLKKRDELFRNPTLKAARDFAPPPPPGKWLNIEGPLVAVHKARLQWLDATDDMLSESVRWLTNRGYKTSFNGAPPLTPEERDRQRVLQGKSPIGNS